MGAAERGPPGCRNCGFGSPWAPRSPSKSSGSRDAPARHHELLRQLGAAGRADHLIRPHLPHQRLGQQRQRSTPEQDFGQTRTRAGRCQDTTHRQPCPGPPADHPVPFAQPQRIRQPPLGHAQQVQPGGKPENERPRRRPAAHQHRPAQAGAQPTPAPPPRPAPGQPAADSAREPAMPCSPVHLSSSPPKLSPRRYGRRGDGNRTQTPPNYAAFTAARKAVKPSGEKVEGGPVGVFESRTRPGAGVIDLDAGAVARRLKPLLRHCGSVVMSMVLPPTRSGRGTPWRQRDGPGHIVVRRALATSCGSSNRR